MTTTDQIFLNILRAGIQYDKAPTDLNLPDDKKGCEALFMRASEQGVLPIIIDTVCSIPGKRSINQEILHRYKDMALKEAVHQIVQTNEFLTLILHMQEQGLDPIVIKGIICRELYPKPMLRLSVDEDLLIERTDAKKYHEFLLSEGLYADEPQTDLTKAYGWSYHKDNSPLYLELQVDLFEPASDAYGDFNKLLENASNRAETVQMEDVTLRTLHPTDHLLFLLCHALKHFMHSGLGIRPACDICLFVQNYHDRIDWDRIAASCQEIHMTGFASGIFQICQKYLGLDKTMIGEQLAEKVKLIDETDLLEDSLDAGLFGTASMNRMHSSTMTLQAVANSKTGKTTSEGLMRSVFPLLETMKKRYPYVKKLPWLLPVAWGHRFFRYIIHEVSGQKSKPMESIKIGKNRVELLKEYGIIE